MPPKYLLFASDILQHRSLQVKTYLLNTILLSTPARSHCAINFGLEIFGDRWSLLLLRDVRIEGKRSYKEFQGSAENIASNVLAQRLRLLVCVGLLTPEKCGTDQRKTLDCKANTT